MPAIRRYDAATDEPAARAILNAGLREQAAYTPDADYCAREWAACTAALDAKPGEWWVAVESGEVAGVLWLEPTPDLLAPYHVVQQVAVAPGRRGQGIGAALVGFAEQEARSAGSLLLIIGGLEANPAMRLYRRLGFEEVPEGYGQPEPGRALLWKRFAGR